MWGHTSSLSNRVSEGLISGPFIFFKASTALSKIWSVVSTLNWQACKRHLPLVPLWGHEPKITTRTDQYSRPSLMTELEPHTAPPLIILQEIRNYRCCNHPWRVVLYSTRCFKRFLVILPLFQLGGSLIFFWDCINRAELVVDRAFPDI